MRVSFQAAVGGWHDFYLLAGTAAATLVGLLFVGLSLHLRIVIASSEVRRFRTGQPCHHDAKLAGGDPKPGTHPADATA